MPTVRAIAVIAIVTCSIPTSAFDAESATRYQTDTLRPLNMPPAFDHGYLAVYEGRGLSVYAASGVLRYRIQNPPQGSIRSVAVDQDGTTATTVNFGYGKGAVWLYDPAGSHVRTLASADFVPSYVAFAPDGSIWTTGTQDRSPGSPVDDYPILRHFSREGAVLGAYLRRSSFRSEREPAESITALPALRIANGRIGMYFPGGGKNHHVWVEADLNGKELGRWPLNIDGYPGAFTEEGEVYAQTLAGIYRLDRASSNWTPTSVAALGSLVGAAGQSLVFADRARPSIYRVSPN